MALGLEAFSRITTGDRIVLDRSRTGGVENSLSLSDKVTAWRNGDSFTHGTAADQTANTLFKSTFFVALVKAEGSAVAAAAALHAGLPVNWYQTGAAMSARQVRQILDGAQIFRKTAMQDTDRNLDSFLAGHGNLSVATAVANRNLPPAAAQDRALLDAVRRGVKEDPSYGKLSLNAAALTPIAGRAIADFLAERSAAFARSNPGLAQYANHAAATDVPRQDVRTFVQDMTLKLVPGSGHPLAAEGLPFRNASLAGLQALPGSTALLGRSAYDLPGMNQLSNELAAKRLELQSLEADLMATAPVHPEAGALQQGLVQELRHQQNLLVAKENALAAVCDNHPMSEKNVAFDTKLWAHAAGYVMENAATYLRAHPPAIGAAAAVDGLRQARTAMQAQFDQAYEDASELKHILAQDKRNNPVVQGKAAVMARLSNALMNVGMPPDRAEALMSGKALAAARRQALNSNQDWLGSTRQMVFERNGVVGQYESNVIPANQINARFNRQYASNDAGGTGAPAHRPRQMVSALTKDDRSHARNLKVSTLERMTPNGLERMATVVGHGVLDMWDIKDPDEREVANARGAHEVLEAAISTNTRLQHEALRRRDAGDPTPVKLTHVSVNLTTPAPLREAPVLGWVGAKSQGKKPEDFQERAFTDAQFAAFRANSTAGNNSHPVRFTMDDSRQPAAPVQDVDVLVDVDVISFSFAINSLATGGGGAMKTVTGLGTWSTVHDRNRTAMEQFVGELGKGEFGSQGSRPGGFIGSVMDLMNPADARQNAQLRRMQGQANLVRQMFSNEAFRTGGGDPAKMGREVLALQAMAEQALEMTNTADMAATLSRGCKSDKDRGGVTDVELKHRLIVEDMGGAVVPNSTLSPEDQRIYNTVAAESGQFENQRANTGVAGSKEIGHLKQRVPDAAFRAYLEGLSKLAEE